MRSVLLLGVLLVGCGDEDQASSAAGAGGGNSGSGAAGGMATASGGSAASGGSGASGAGGGGVTCSGSIPSWRQGLAKWQWAEIPGSSLANQPVPDPFTGDLGAPTQRIDAWNGLTANRDTGDIYLACAGGHGDWAGNEVYAVDLAADAPHWQILRGPTPGDQIGTNQPYYADGRPSSTHLYYALHFVRARGRVFKMSAGSVWGDGNSNNNNVDAFDLAANDWDPAGTYETGPGGSAISRPYAADPATDDTYTLAVGAFWKWSSTTATFSELAPRPDYANDDIVNESPSAVDPTRQRLLFARNAYRIRQRQGLRIDFDGALADVTFTGEAADRAISAQAGMEYVASDDAFLLKTAAAGDVVRIDAETFEATTLATSGAQPPDAVNGVYTRWLYLPCLAGIAYLPSGAANFWFLSTE